MRILGDIAQIPKAASFSSEQDADATLGPKLQQVSTAYIEICKAADLNGSDCWLIAAPEYLRSKGWRVSIPGGNFIVHTEDVEKRS